MSIKKGQIRNQSIVKIEKLLEPGYIGKVKTRNRIFKTAAGQGAWDMMSGTLTAAGLAYTEALLKGGVGALNSAGFTFPPFAKVGLYYDDQIAAHLPLIELAHKYDCPIFIQFLGGSSSSGVDYTPALEVAMGGAPKAMTLEDIQKMENDIVSAAVRAQKAGYDGIDLNASCNHMFDTFLSRFWNTRQDQYGPQSLENRARIVIEIIQGIKQSCGSDFPVMVLYNGREVNVFEVGNDEKCISIEESTEFAKLFEQAGADLLQIRGATFGDHPKGFFPELFYLTGAANNSYGYDYDIKKFWPEFVTRYGGAGGYIETAAKIKQAVSIPVMTVGSMDPRLIPETIENALRDGKIDFVAMTRALFADPELPNKLATGKLEDIRPCTYCYTCFMGGSGFCRVNGAFGRTDEDGKAIEYDIQPAATKKKVLVVGGGPAGMEAARVAALRGHKVTLYEESTKLGGSMPVAALVKGQHEKIMAFVNYLSNQMNKLGVKVETGKKIDLSTVNKFKPDVAIIATGGTYTTPNIPGIDNPKVVSSASLHRRLETGLKYFSPSTLRSLTNFYLPVGKKVVVIGAQIHGAQVAKLLVERGKEVTIVDEGGSESDPVAGRTGLPTGIPVGLPAGTTSGSPPRGFPAGGPPAGLTTGVPVGLPAGIPGGAPPSGFPAGDSPISNFGRSAFPSYLGKGMPNTSRDRLIYYLHTHGVKILTGVKYNEITDEGLSITSGGVKTIIKADNIVLALPLTANTSLADSLKAQVKEVYAVGDCKTPGIIETSVADAYSTARKI